MSADLARLAQVLDLERRGGCRDQAVQGGLDALLRLQARDEPARSPLMRMVMALPDAGYRSLGADERERWLRRAQATIAQAGAPRRTRARAAGAPAAPPRTRAAARPRDAAPAGEAALELPIAQAGARLGKANLGRLRRIGIETAGDALQHWPHRHKDFTRTVPIAALRLGEEQTLRGAIESAREVRWGRKGTEATVSDGTGARMRVIWFNQTYLARELRPGMEIALSGKVTAYRGRPTMANPDFEPLDGERRHTGRLVPVYPSTEGLAQRTLRTAIARVLDRFGDRLPETLPEDLRARHGLPGAAEAARQMHYPDSEERLALARRRLAFDELLAVQLGAVRRKRERQSRGAPPFGGREAAEAFLGALPFALTGAQRRALGEVLADLAQPRPMARLLQGDVGSGKTVVALAAMLAAVAGGCQAALMAPTEVLAEQHYRTLCALLSGEPEPPLRGMVHLPFLPEPLRVALLTGSARAKERRDALDAIRHGGAQIAVGTHALIQRGVGFRRLGLAVVDEQHRFGVDQREAIRGAPDRRYGDGGDGGDGGEAGAHLLVMTATPIPRSLALTIYGDLDLSTIGELPPGRAPTETVAIPQPPWEDAEAMREYAERRAGAFARVRAEVAAGRQAFVICPLVEGSRNVAARAATEEYERLCSEEFPDLAGRIELLHGRMSGRDKDAAMRRFAAGETAILVSTAVVEVGIDVPNATAMVIEGANRFGLAQLHQFRGRVGRGALPSICFLLGDDPRPPEPPAEDETEDGKREREQREQQRAQRREAAEERLSLVARNHDGFGLAQADLELRDAGDLFGTRQAGESSLRVASLRDVRLIETSRREAEALLDADPALAAPQHAALRALAARAAATAEAH